VDKRLLSFDETLGEYMDTLHKMYERSGNELVSREALEHARLFDLRINQVAWAIDAIRSEATKPKRMGRHSRPEERDRQNYDHMTRWQRSEEIHGHEGISYDDAYVKAGKELHVSPEAVKKSRLKVIRSVSRWQEVR
jgi:hypothetical protein